MSIEDVWKELGDSPRKEKETPQKPSFQGRELARYFQDQFIGAPWHSGFGMINVQALSMHIAKWKSRTDSDTVKAMIDLYMTDASVRGKNPGWEDFLRHAEEINAKLKPQSTEDEWERLRRLEEEEYG